MSGENDADAAAQQEHRWLYVRLGRVCERCGLTQANGEFDDAAPCTRPKPSAPEGGPGSRTHPTDARFAGMQKPGVRCTPGFGDAGPGEAEF